MEMISTVLSILSCLFLWLLLFVLALLLMVLFVPFCYKVTVDCHEELSVNGRVSWCNFLARLKFSYAGEKADGVLRILGINVGKFLAWRKKRKKKRAIKKKNKVKKKESKQKQAKQQPDSGEKPKEVKETQEEEHSEEKSRQQDEQQDDEQKKQQDEPSKGEQEKELSGEREEGKKKKKDSKRKKTTKSRVSIKERIKAVQNFLKSLSHMLHQIRKKASWGCRVKEFLQEENTRRMVCILKDNVVHLWRKLKPKVLRGKIEFGTEDPCLTGEILGVAAMFFACYGRNVEVIPDFNEEKLDWNLFIKGRVSLITILVIIIRIMISKEWNRFQKEIEELKEAL